MKAIARTVLPILLIYVFVPKNISVAASFKISSYDIRATYLESNKLQVQARIIFYRNNSHEKVFFLVKPNITNLSAKLFTIKNYGKVALTQRNDTLELRLPGVAVGQQKLQIVFDYSLYLDSLFQGVTTASYWYPYLYNNTAKYRLKVETPTGYVVLTPGILIEKTIEPRGTRYFSEMDRQVPRFDVIIARADSYTKFRNLSNNVVMDFYFLNKDTTFSADTSIETEFINDCLGSFKFFNRLIGNYAYRRLTFVEVPGIEMVNSQPSFIEMGCLFLKIYRQKIYDWPAHEIAHQWFGSGVFVEHGEVKDICVFEFLAEYLRLMYVRSNAGEIRMDQELNAMVNEYNSDYAGTSEDVPLTKSGSSRVTYLKGTFVMNRINKILGDVQWKRFLESLYRGFSGKMLTYDDFTWSLLRYNEKAVEAFKRLTAEVGKIQND